MQNRQYVCLAAVTSAVLQDTLAVVETLTVLEAAQKHPASRLDTDLEIVPVSA
jgi:hypothetical protein